VLGYQDNRAILGLVIPGLENVDKTRKLNLRINLSISSDLGIAIPSLNLSSIKPGISSAGLWGRRARPLKGASRLCR